MNNPPALSVIVRTVARNKRLAECLDSLAAQTFRDFEVVVVDMSGGGAHEVIKQPRELRLLHLDTKGRVLNRPVALNYGIRRASGKYIAVLDDDNFWLPPQVKTLVNLFKNVDADLVYTGVMRQTNTEAGVRVHEEQRYQPFNYQRLIETNYIYASATAFRKKAWKEVGRYDARFHIYEDWEFLIRILQKERVVSEESFWAVSRNFTGDPSVASHNLDKLDCRRCRTAVIWKHRHLHARALAEKRASRFVNTALTGPFLPRFSLLYGWWKTHGLTRLKYYFWNL